ncbi:MAG: outer membrane protein assembly factor BamE [Coxiellaceae bacterium]|nr:MAG: outer membrane protein assembly factor BamE [Coxiellaceae bacterium]
MRKAFQALLIATCIILTGCTNILKPYQPPIQQGNILTADMVQKIKPGLNKREVLNILGNPVLTDPFDENTWIYVYTLKPSHGKYQEKKLLITFRNGRVVSYSTNINAKQLPMPSLTK